MRIFRKSIHLLAAIAVVVAASATNLSAQLSATVPVLSSRPGAAYTFYLNPSGFAYDGTWVGASLPGTNLGFRNRAPGDTFSSADQAAIRAIWAQQVNQFRSFDVNVTTIDPAIAAGQAGSDILRRNYYDSQARMMHTIIGPPGNPGWQGGADGIAKLGGIDTVQPIGSGGHTNFMFSQDVNTGSDVGDGTYIGSIASHETGHTYGLRHQGDYSAGVKVNEYGFGDTNTGNGSYVGIMGNASDRQRVAWRNGPSHLGNDLAVQQNDVGVIMSNNGMTMIDSGIGHSFATATALPVTGAGIIDVSNPLHRGVISPINVNGTYNPMGIDNYTKDYYAFTSDGINAITLTVNNGNDFLAAGVADNGATLRSILNIYDSTFNFVAGGVGIEDASTMFSSYTGLLGSGQYYAQITSFGGHAEVSTFDPAFYFDMGGYFLTGSGFSPVPEPGSATFFVFCSVGLMIRRRRGSV